LKSSIEEHSLKGYFTGLSVSVAPETTRTSDLRFRKPLLYPAELLGLFQAVLSAVPFYI
jgi:hypothetical protein